MFVISYLAGLFLHLGVVGDSIREASRNGPVTGHIEAAFSVSRGRREEIRRDSVII